MFGFGTQELLIILIIALFLFGGKKLPEIGAGLGKGLRSFKKGLKEVDEDIKPEVEMESHKKEPVHESAQAAGTAASQKSS